jgi:5'-phosphate synthase pdxT subunit
MSDLTIGVLALQGDFREHAASVAAVGARAVLVRRPAELDAVEALVIPGGESTAMWKLATVFEMFEPVRKRIADGMPVYGSCAGMIMLADRIVDAAAGQETFGGIAMTVRRNAFGRQTESFEEAISFDWSGAGRPSGSELTGDLTSDKTGDKAGGRTSDMTGVFIRAPWVEEVGPGVDVLARVTAGPATGRIVAVRQGDLLATSFHPELTADHRVHAYFADLVRSARR